MTKPFISEVIKAGVGAYLKLYEMDKGMRRLKQQDWRHFIWENLKISTRITDSGHVL